jgi:transposase
VPVQASRKQAINQLKAVLVIADPALRERLSRLGDRELFRTCSRLTLRDGDDEDAVAQAIRITLRLPAQRIEQLTGQIDELSQRLTRLVERHAPQLLTPVGAGPDSAVNLWTTMGDNPEPLNAEASFAALFGVSPVENSSAGGTRVGSTTAATGRPTPLCTGSCSPGCDAIPTPRRTANAVLRRARPALKSSGSSSDMPPERSFT